MTATLDIAPAQVVRVDVIRGVRTVVICCPYCAKLHTHGWPYEWADVGTRVAHCSGPNRTSVREYRVVGTADLTRETA